MNPNNSANRVALAKVARSARDGTIKFLFGATVMAVFALVFGVSETALKHSLPWLPTAGVNLGGALAGMAAGGLCGLLLLNYDRVFARLAWTWQVRIRNFRRR